MADNDQDTQDRAQEGQGEAEDKKATQTPPAENNAPSEAQATAEDPFALRQGETPDQYSARVRKEVEWRDKQIGRQHRQLKERDERLTKAQEIEAENRRLTELAAAGTKKATKDTEDTQSAPQPSPRAPAAGVSQEALAAARLQIGMERVGEQLQKQKDWPTVAANFEKAGGIDPGLFNAALDTDDPAHVLMVLGRDMGEYQRIMDLPEGRRRAALIKIGMETETPPAAPPKPKPSAAPSPTGGLPGGSAGPVEGDVDIYDPKFASPEYDANWYAKRQEQKRNSRGRPWSVGGRSGA